MVVITTSDPDSETESKEMDYRKVIVNIPKPLLDTFDLACKFNFYTRKEAIKQAMRQFIEDEMPEDWVPPAMHEYEKETLSDYMEGLALGAARAAQNPEIIKAQQLQTQQPPNLPKPKKTKNE